MTLQLLFSPLRALLPALLLSALSARAQPEPMKLGKVEGADLTAAPFRGDSAAAAVILCDYGSSRIEAAATGQMQLVYERSTRIKILKKSGFDWATVEIPLQSSGEKISGLRGFTYNLVGGGVVKEKLESDGTYVDDVTRHLRIRKFTLPNVREGSVIEYSYTVVSESFYNLPEWQFQYPIPVRWSEYRAFFPEYFDFRTLMQGYLSPTVQEKAEASTQVAGAAVSATRYRWAMRNVPAFVAEPYITTARDYESRLDFELASVHFRENASYDVTLTWPKFDKLLLESDDFGRQCDRGGFLKEELAKLPAVRSLVLGAVKYNEHEAMYTLVPLKKTYQQLHLGNAADVNLLLIAALRTAGIAANPVILSTRSDGRLHAAVPLMTKFNYVVAHVQLPNNEDLLVDATEPLLPCGVLPERCLNQVGRLVLEAKDASRWVELKPQQRRVHFQHAKLTLSASGAVSGTVHEEFGGYTAAQARAELQQLGEAKYRSQFAGRHSAWTVPKFTVANRAEVTKPLGLDYEFSQAAAENAPAGTFYFSPLEEFTSLENPFRHENRTYPVDFGTTRDETMVVTLTLPAGYELAETPKPAVVELPEGGGRFVYNVAGSGETVQLANRLSLRKPMYAAAEYEYLRQFYQLMLTKQAEKLVIRKKA